MEARLKTLRVYHIAEADNWPSIQRDGLLSARALFERAGARTSDRPFIEQHRQSRTTLGDGTVIRDQSPMPPSQLRKCLTGGLTPEDWYLLLNGKVFFWFNTKRVEKHLRACRRTSQIVLTIDADKLVKHYEESASVSAFNTGYAKRSPTARGLATFVPWKKWLETAWQHEAEGVGRPLRKRSYNPVELTIDQSVPDILDFIIARRKVAAA